MTVDEAGDENFASEVASGNRFGFGENWARFLRGLREDQIVLAQQSLQRMLETESLAGKSFLDIGSGSGLFSLAARRLGARVHSLDYDPNSVACGQELRRRYFSGDTDWTIERGSVLDSAYLNALGQFDVVYSWGVLHHTGQMWQALQNVVPLVVPKGRLYIAIYNDQGRASKVWTSIKRLYNATPVALRPVVAAACAVRLRGPTLLRNMLSLQPPRSWLGSTERGMKIWTDIVDWVGGYPFEVAKPEEIFSFFRARGFALLQLKTCAGGQGCCEYVFEKVSTAPGLADQ